MHRARGLSALAALMIVLACSAEPNRQFASIGTGGTGGIYYPLGGALARMLTARLPDTTFTAEVTGGSVENLNRVARGEMDMGMGMGTTLAKTLTSGDAGRYRRVRVVAPLYPNLAHILVRRSVDVRSPAQLAGMRLSIGVAGSGTEQMARDLLDAYGLRLEEVEPRYLSFAESSAALRDGAVDAAILAVGYPAAAVLEATTAARVQLIGIDPDGLDSLILKYPYYRRASIPAQTYPGVVEPLPTAAVMNWLFAPESLDPAIVEAVLELLQTHREDLRRVNAIADQIDLGALASAPLPLHAATAAWLARQ